jgi:hypothetical protein
MRRGVGVSVTVVEAMNSWPKRGARMNLGALGPGVAAEDSAEGGRKSCAGEKPSVWQRSYGVVSIVCEASPSEGSWVTGEL